jgi:hypothetical protein
MEPQVGQFRMQDFILEEIAELQQAQMWQNITIGLIVIVNFLYVLLN